MVAVTMWYGRHLWQTIGTLSLLLLPWQTPVGNMTTTAPQTPSYETQQQP